MYAGENIPMDALDLMEWEAAWNIDPWGEERADLRTGVLCSLVDACHRSSGQPEPPLHYMPYVKALTKNQCKQNDADMKAIFEAAAKAWGKS